MRTPPLISVIIPCFNAEKWIAKSINSILEQTYNNFEILVFNDGSQDDSLKIIKTITLKSASIKIINEPCNNGIVYSLNRSIAEAQGKFIARMDADDVAHPQRLERQVKFLSENNVDLCGTWFKEFGQGAPRITRWPTSHQALEASLLFQNTICHPTIMARREVFDDFPYREEFNLAEDYDFFSRAIKKYKFNNIPEPLLNYRRHSSQATQAKKERMELITRQIRVNALQSIGVFPTEQQALVHNTIRAPQSICTLRELELIEEWLTFLLCEKKSSEFNSIVASQWIRACIRAAPLGGEMRKKYFSSHLLTWIKPSSLMNFDVFALSVLKLNYNSEAFKILRRMGLSA
ncbi:glycosly transferase [Cellvibrio zantedeschiae]|uniref:Glycosly transferase n=1 Tax=Cellvibrio zantedeschiae TaxID=1237077 RepID=A0ABQ3AP50_9GAMM|nr:glycosyltransferase [Cellvibrio zantedeschiae]GGY62919.1 glycosly transferase [Cellvibrio zantedeschiae]